MQKLKIPNHVEPIAEAKAEQVGPDKQPKTFSLYNYDDEITLKIRVPYVGVVTKTTADCGGKYARTNTSKGYLNDSNEKMDAEDVIVEFEKRTGEIIHS